MRSRAVVAIALLVVLTSFLGGPASAAPSEGGVPAGTALADGPAPAASLAAVDPPDGPLDNGTFDRPDPHTVITITVSPDGDARFSIASLYTLDDANETEAFDDFASRVVGGGVQTRYSVETFQRYADAASAATGREMEIRDANWSERTVNGTGHLTYSFTWTNFADTSDERLRVGDAFAGRSGTWFPRLTDGQRLVIASEAPYNSVFDAPRPPDNGTISWLGPQQFETGDVYVVYTSTPGTTTPTPTPTPTPPTAAPAPGDSSGSALPMALIGVGVLILFVAVGAGGYLLAQRRRFPGSDAGDDGPPVAGAEVAETDGEGARVDPVDPEAGASGTAAADEAAATDADGAAAAGETGAAETDEDATDDEEEEEIDLDLLSDEERVERLLQDNGGRMKQGNIVSETGWSNAKVSQLLSSMDDDDRINKLRIGRENLIALPDEDIGEID